MPSSYAVSFDEQTSMSQVAEGKNPILMAQFSRIRTGSVTLWKCHFSFFCSILKCMKFSCSGGKESREVRFENTHRQANKFRLQLSPFNPPQAEIFYILCLSLRQDFCTEIVTYPSAAEFCYTKPWMQMTVPEIFNLCLQLILSNGVGKLTPQEIGSTLIQCSQMELWGTKLQVEQSLGSRNMWFWGEIKQTWLDSKEGLDFCLLTQNLPNDGKKVSNTKQKAYDVSMNGFYNSYFLRN